MEDQVGVSTIFIICCEDISIHVQQGLQLGLLVKTFQTPFKPVNNGSAGRWRWWRGAGPLAVAGPQAASAGVAGTSTLTVGASDGELVAFGGGGLGP